MLEKIINKIIPYKIIIVPVNVYEHSENSSRELIASMTLMGGKKRFFTKKGFESYIKRMEHKDTNWSIITSRRPDEKTYLAVPDITSINPGNFTIEIRGEYKKYFQNNKGE